MLDYVTVNENMIHYYEEHFSNSTQPIDAGESVSVNTSQNHQIDMLSMLNGSGKINENNFTWLSCRYFGELPIVLSEYIKNISGSRTRRPTCTRKPAAAPATEHAHAQCKGTDMFIVNLSMHPRGDKEVYQTCVN